MLKRILAATAALALFALPLAAQEAGHGAMGNEVTLTGQVIDVYCYTSSGGAASGAGHKACAEACAKAGEPLAILADGVIYMAISAKPADPQNPRLLPFAEGRVRVTGTHRMQNGLHSIEIKTIQAAS